MSDENTLVFEVEADETQAARSTDLLLAQITALKQGFGQIETLLGRVLGSDLVAASRNLGMLVSELNKLERSSTTLGRAQQLGGAFGVARAGTMRGTISGLQDDPLAQQIRLEKEQDRALANRIELYRRLKNEMPDASDARVLRAYQAAMLEIDTGLQKRRNVQGEAIKDVKARQQMMQESVVVQAEANKQILAENEALYQKDLVVYERYLAQKSRLAEVASGARTREEVLNSAFTGARRRGVNIRPEDEARLAAQFDTNLEQHQILYPPRAPKPAKPQLSREERIQQLAESRVESRNAQFEYMGGAPVMLAEAHTLMNYAMIGGAMGAAGATIKGLVDLQEELRAIQAAAGATDGQMVRLQSDILAVGASSSKSLKDIAEAATVLAHAGIPLDQIGKSLAQITKTATATHTEVKAVAQTTTDVIDTFHMSVDEMSQVQATIGNLAIKSKVSVEDLGNAVKASGQFAAGSGVQFQEYAGAMAAMAAAGIHNGQQIGQGIRQLIESLDNPNKKMLETLKKVGLTADDVSVRSQGLAGALDNLKSHGIDAAAGMSIFNIRTYAAYAALSQHLDVLKEANKSLADNALVDQSAAANMNTFGASAQRLSNNLMKVTSEAGGPMLGFLKSLMEGTAAVADLIGKASIAVAGFGTVIASIAIATMTVKIGALAKGFFDMATKMDILTAATGAWAAVMAGDVPAALTILNLALGPAGWIAIGLTAAIGAFSIFKSVSEESAQAVQRFGDQAQEAGSQAHDLGEKISALNDFQSVLADRTGHAGDLAEQAAARFSKWGLTLDSTKVSAMELSGAIADLTAKMEAQQAVALHAQANALNQKAQALQPQVDSARHELFDTASGMLSRPDLVKLFGANYVMKMQSPADFTVEDMRHMYSRLAFANQKDPLVARLRDALDAYEKPLSQQTQARDQAAQANTDAGVASDISSPAYQQLRMQARQRLAAARKARADALNMPRGPQQAAALQKAQADADAAVKDISSRGATFGSALDQMPELDQLRNMGTDPGTTKAGLRAHLSALEAQWRDTKDKNLEPQIVQAAINQLDPTAPDYATQVQDTQDRYQAMFDQANSRQATHVGHQHASNLKKLADIQKQRIADMQANFSLTPGDQANEQSQLQSALVKWKSLSEQALRADKSGPELQAALADLDEKANKYFAEVLRGNAKAIADTTAKAAATSAQQAKGNALFSIAQGGSLSDAMKAMDDAAGAALKAKLDAIKADYAAAHPQMKAGTIPAELQRQLDEASAKAAASMITSNIAAIQAATKAANERAQVAYNMTMRPLQERAAVRGAIGNLSNYGQIGDAHAFLLDQQARQDAIPAAQAALTLAQQHRDNAASQFNQIDAQVRSAGGLNNVSTAVQAQWTGAKKALDQYDEALARAQDNVTRLTQKLQPLTTWQQAVNAAWLKFAHQTQLDKPFYEQLADGLSGAFEKSYGAFGTFLSKVESGTGKVKNYFRDMVMSILQAMQQMINEIIAKKLFQIIASFIPMPGGAPGGATNFTPGLSSGGTSFFPGHATGGLIRHYADGGFNRDSVPAMLMPGEFVMSKTATDFIGADTLSQMNTMGNRRISTMPSIKDGGKPAAPMQTNVWVVAPGQKPQLGKNDVLHIIGDDIMSNGQTKKLIKAVAMGAA